MTDTDVYYDSKYIRQLIDVFVMVTLRLVSTDCLCQLVSTDCLWHILIPMVRNIFVNLLMSSLWWRFDWFRLIAYDGCWRPWLETYSSNSWCLRYGVSTGFDWLLMMDTDVHGSKHIRQLADVFVMASIDLFRLIAYDGCWRPWFQIFSSTCWCFRYGGDSTGFDWLFMTHTDIYGSKYIR